MLSILKNIFKKEQGPEYISGRLATKKEVKFGFFSLVADTGEPMTEPHKITIPQKVQHFDEQTKEKREATLIQAEKVTQKALENQVICTIRLEDNTIMMCKLEELTLEYKE